MEPQRLLRLILMLWMVPWVQLRQAAGAPAPSQPALTAAVGQPRASSQPQRILEAATAALAPPKAPTPPAGARASATVRSTAAAPVVQAGACSATGYCFVSATAVDATCPAGTRAAPGTKPLQCYRGCPAGSTLKSDSGTLMCVGGCPTGYSTDGNGQCVEECPDGYTNNGNGQCVQNCPPGTQAYSAHGETTICITPCPINTAPWGSSCASFSDWYYHAGTCDSCPQTGYVPTPADPASWYLQSTSGLAPASGADNFASTFASTGAASGDGGTIYNTADPEAAAQLAAFDAQNADTFRATVDRISKQFTTPTTSASASPTRTNCACRRSTPRGVTVCQSIPSNIVPVTNRAASVSSPTCAPGCTYNPVSALCVCATGCPAGFKSCSNGLCATRSTIYGLDACTVFNAPSVNAALDRRMLCGGPLPAGTPPFG